MLGIFLDQEIVTGFVKGLATGFGNSIGSGIGVLALPFILMHLKKAKTTLFPEKDKDGSRSN